MKICFRCEKGYLMGGTRKLLRGNYNPTNMTKKHPNLQWANLVGHKTRVRLCVKCLRIEKAAKHLKFQSKIKSQPKPKKKTSK